MGKKNLRGANDAGPLIKIGAGIALSILLIPVFIVVLTGLKFWRSFNFSPRRIFITMDFCFF